MRIKQDLKKGDNGKSSDDCGWMSLRSDLKIKKFIMVNLRLGFQMIFGIFAAAQN